jgi:hypothetical protein
LHVISRRIDLWATHFFRPSKRSLDFMTCRLTVAMTNTVVACPTSYVSVRRPLWDASKTYVVQNTANEPEEDGKGKD